MHAACEEADGMETAAAGFDMGAARLFVASLGPKKDGTDTFEVTLPVVRIKRQRADQGVGGVADLAQRDRRVFPPEAAGSGAPGTNDLPS
jgi:hypothetical protein